MTIKHKMKLIFAKLTWDKGNQQTIKKIKIDKDENIKKIIDKGDRVLSDARMVMLIEDQKNNR